MKYQDKVKFIEIATNEFIEGASIQQVSDLLLEKYELNKYDLDNIFSSSRANIFDKYESLISSKILGEESLESSEELVKIDKSILLKLKDKAIYSLAQNELKKVNELLKQGFAQEEILEEIRLDIYPDERVIGQIERHNLIKEKKAKKNKWFLIAGCILLTIAGFTMFDGSSKRPLYGIGVAGLILLYRGSK